MSSVLHHALRASLVLGIFAAAFADELPLRDRDDVKDHLLVLTNGRVISGQLIPRTDGGYDVLQPVGRIFVPSQQIRFKATDLPDAHQKLRDSLQELTPDTHIELARWCLTNNLRGQARNELLDALHLDPYRAEAKRMLEDLKRDERRARLSNSSTSVKFDPAMLTTPELLPERRSLGGLPESTAADFTRRIQPLLSNKCGNARCHGAGRNSFAMVTVRDRSTPAIAEQNLAAVLKQIDFTTPEQSPLLNATVGLHGGNRKLMLNGRTGERQLQILRDWVMSAASAMDKDSVTQARASDSSQREASQENEITQTAFRFTDDAQSADTMLSERDRRMLKEADEAIRQDAFDPNVFNRRYHGRATEKTGP